MKKIYKFLSSIKLTILLTFLIVINTITGSLVLLDSPDAFRDIDKRLLVHWLYESSLSASWWIFVLIILLCLFSLNTVFCTYDRLSSLIRAWRGKGFKRVESEEASLVTEDIQRKGVRLRTFLPYLAHIGFLIALSGQLAGSLWGFRGEDVMAGSGETRKIKESSDLSIRIGDLHMKLAKGGYPEEMSGGVSLISKGKVLKEKTIAINSPLIYGDIAVYIKTIQPVMQGLVLRKAGNEQGETFLLKSGMRRPLMGNDLQIAGGRVDQRYDAMEVFLFKGGRLLLKKWLSPSLPGRQQLSFDGGMIIAEESQVINVGTFTLNKDPGALIVFTGLGLFGLSLFAHIIIRKRA